MSEQPKYTERDLFIASELGALTKVVMNLDSKMTEVVRLKENDHKIMWEKIDNHNEKISNQSALIKWIIGIGIGLQTAWVIFIGFFKH